MGSPGLHMHLIDSARPYIKVVVIPDAAFVSINGLKKDDTPNWK